MIYVSHQAGEITRLASQVVRIEDGQVLAAGGLELLDAEMSALRRDMLRRMFPPSRIVCLTEETVETLYLLGEDAPHRRRVRLCGAAAPGARARSRGWRRSFPPTCRRSWR